MEPCFYSENGCTLHIPVMVTSEALELEIERALRTTPMLAEKVRSWGELCAVSPEAPTCLLGPDVLVAADASGQLQGLFRANPYISLTLVLESGVGDPPSLAGWRSHPMVALAIPREAQRLPGALCRAYIRNARLRLEMTLSILGSWLPPVVRSALRSALRSEINSPHLRIDSHPRPSVALLALETGVSRSHLSALSNECGIRLPGVVSAWCAVQALIVRVLERSSWLEVAWRCGYRSEAGLSELFLRTFGRRLRGLEGPSLLWALEWMEKDVLIPILRPEHRRHTVERSDIL